MLTDKGGHIAYVERSSEHMEVMEYKEGRRYLISTNRFILPRMLPCSITVDDDRNAEARHESIEAVLLRSSSWSLDTIRDSLVSASTYDTSTTGHDTVWSILEDMNAEQNYLCEGNPSRDDFHMVNL